MMARDTAFSFVEGGTNPAEVLCKRAWLMVHVPCVSVMCWGPRWQTFFGEDKVLLLLLFLSAQHHRCG